MGAQDPLIVLFNHQQRFLLERDGKPGVWMGGASWALSLALWKQGPIHAYGFRVPGPQSCP